MRHFKRRKLRHLLAFILTGAVATAALAADRGTAFEAKAMLMKAVAHYKSVGRKRALADFTAGKPPFRNHDLYVLCIDRQFLVSANGAFPDDVYVTANVLKTPDGQGIGTSAWASTQTTGEGTVRYRWVNPSTHQMEWKLAFFARVGEDVCGVGVYRPE